MKKLKNLSPISMQALSITSLEGSPAAACSELAAEGRAADDAAARIKCLIPLHLCCICLMTALDHCALGFSSAGSDISSNWSASMPRLVVWIPGSGRAQLSTITAEHDNSPILKKNRSCVNGGQNAQEECSTPFNRLCEQAAAIKAAILQAERLKAQAMAEAGK